MGSGSGERGLHRSQATSQRMTAGESSTFQACTGSGSSSRNAENRRRKASSQRSGLFVASARVGRFLGHIPVEWHRDRAKQIKSQRKVSRYAAVGRFAPPEGAWSSKPETQRVLVAVEGKGDMAESDEIAEWQESLWVDSSVSPVSLIQIVQIGLRE